MKIIYKHGIVDVDAILKKTGRIDMAVRNFSENIVENITKDNCYHLVIMCRIKKWHRESITIYETFSEEDAERMKKEILDAYAGGRSEVFRIWK